MNTLNAFLLPALLLSSAALAQPSGPAWTLDSTHSRAGFVARHLGLAKVRGEFTQYTATAKADPKTGKLTELSAEAHTRSIDTGNAKRDDHLRSDDFFNAEKFPKLSLKLKNITWKGEAFKATATITIRDITKDVPVTGKLAGFTTVNFGAGPQLRAAYELNGTINRKEFGLKYSGLAEATAIVADNVELELEGSFYAPLPNKI